MNTDVSVSVMVYDPCPMCGVDQVARGAEIEQRRIIKLLEDNARECEKAGLWANGIELRGQLQELHLGLNAAIALIKGENK